MEKHRGSAQDESDLLSTGGTERPHGLKELRTGEADCRRCPLYKHATQVVPGEGARSAAVMFVGEQPGDQEDIQGKPFVGPAGHLLDRALNDAGIERGRIFVTNAVKHFKFEQRGKRRLRKRPNAYEIERCKWWLDSELALVKPRLAVALGVTAARSLLSRSVTISATRGKFMPRADHDGIEIFVTVHPSSLLRAPDADTRERNYKSFVADLRAIARHVPDVKVR
jgi:DNA polymerase